MIDKALHNLHQQAVKILSVLEAYTVAIDQPDADPQITLVPWSLL